MPEFIPLKPFHERHDPSLSADAIAAVLRKRFQEEIQERVLAVFGAPAVDGLGDAAGSEMLIQASGDVNYRRPPGSGRQAGYSRAINNPVWSVSLTVSARERRNCLLTWTEPKSKRWACNSPTYSTRCKLSR